MISYLWHCLSEPKTLESSFYWLRKLHWLQRALPNFSRSGELSNGWDMFLCFRLFHSLLFLQKQNFVCMKPFLGSVNIFRRTWSIFMYSHAIFFPRYSYYFDEHFLRDCWSICIMDYVLRFQLEEPQIFLLWKRFSYCVK